MRASLVLALAIVTTVTFPARAEDLASAATKAADALATALMASPEQASIRQVAMLPFTEGTGASGLGRAVSDVLGARFARTARVKVIDPEAVRTVMGERKLQEMLGAERADDPDLASKVGAQAALTGSVDKDGPRVRVSVRLTLIGGGKLIGSAQGVADDPKPAGAESGSIEIAMRRLSDGLAAGFGRLPGNQRYRRLAVLTFSEVGDRVQKQKLGTIITAEVATNLKRDHGLFLVERARLGEVLSEMKLQEMTSPDPAQSSKIGQMADAQAIVIGSVAEAGDRYLVTVRIIATQTGETLAAESTSVAEAGMTSIASDAVVLRSRGDAVMRSLLFPGLGQSYNRQGAKALAFAGTEIALLGAAVAYHLSATSAWNQYKDVSQAGGGSPSAEATRLYDLSSSRYSTRNWLLAGGAAVWVVGLVDAWVSGVDGQAMLGGGKAAASESPRSDRLVLVPIPAAGGAGLALSGRF